jgi:hypothetical protein
MLHNVRGMKVIPICCYSLPVGTPSIKSLPEGRTPQVDVKHGSWSCLGIGTTTWCVHVAVVQAAVVRCLFKARNFFMVRLCLRSSNVTCCTTPYLTDGLLVRKLCTPSRFESETWLISGETGVCIGI